MNIHAHDLVGKNVGQYSVEGYVTSGSFGHVYKVRRLREPGGLAALKMLRTELFMQDGRVEGFKKEAELIASLKHPHILSAEDYGSYNMVPFFVTPFVTKGDLRRKHPKGTNVSLEDVITYVSQLASALQYSHDKKVIHRDLKPANILVGDEGLLLTDFGLAITAHSLGSLSTQNIGGTAPYMAPEQFDGQAQIFTDQYALGVITYELLNGQLPFTPGDVSGNAFIAYNMLHHDASIPKFVVPMSEDVISVVSTALQKNPEERFTNITAFATALRSSLRPVEIFSKEPRTDEEEFIHMDFSPEVQELKEQLRFAIEEIAELNSTLGKKDLVVEQLHDGYNNLKYRSSAQLRRKDEEIERLQSLREEIKTLRDQLAGKHTEIVALVSEKVLLAEELEKAQPKALAPIIVKAEELISRGDPLFADNMFGEALVWYNKALKLDDQNVEVLFKKGLCLEKLGRLELAGTAFAAALQLDLDAHREEALFTKGLCLEKLGRLELAGTAFMAAIQIDSDHIEALFGKARIFTLLGKMDEAQEAFYEVFALDPTHKEARAFNPFKKCIRTITGHTVSVESVAWSPDGKSIVSGSEDKSVRIWDASSGNLVRTLTGHTEWVSSVAWSPDRKYILSGSADNSVRIWDASSGNLVRTLTGHTSYVRSVAWSPDGKFLVSGSRDKSVRIWDASSGNLVRTLTGHIDSVRSVAFSPDGKSIVSGSEDKSVRIWE